MSEHALLSASSSARWIACPGSVALCKDIPNTSNKYSEHGTAMHELAAKILTSQIAKGFDLYKAENGVVLKNDDIIQVMKYVDFVRSLPGTLMVEKKVDYSRFIGVENSFGTSDAIIVSDDGEEIVICDLKGGSGIRVDAEENSQLMLYALGAIEEVSFLYPNLKRARLIIHQPRLDHISEWDCTVGQLYEFAKDAELAAANATGCLKEPDKYLAISLIPGEHQCQFCPAKAKCPALKAFVNTATEEQFDIVTDEVTPETLDLVDAWVLAKRGEVESRLLKGEKLTHWKLVQGRAGKRSWTNADEAEALLKSFRLKVAQMYDLSLISPTSAEKLLKDNPRKWKKVEELIGRSDPKPSVAPISDKRPALALAKPEDGFEVINNEEGW